MLPRFIFLLSLIAVDIAHSLQSNELDNPVENDFNFTENFPADSGKVVHLYRQKRGWGALLFKGFSTLTKVTSMGLTLSVALTEGCAFYPSICDDKKEIERLDQLIKDNSNLYEKMYFEAKQSDQKLLEALRTNVHISNYINQAMEHIENIIDKEEQMSSMFQNILPETDSTNYTIKMHLEQVVCKLEYRLSDLQIMLNAHKQESLTFMVAQFVVETTIRSFFTAVKNAYKQVSNAAIFKNNFLWHMNGANVPVLNRNLRNRLNIVPKVLKQMAINYGRSVVRTFTNIMKTPTVQRVKLFFNPKTHSKFVKIQKLSLYGGLMGGLGIAADVLSQVLLAKQWKNAATEMHKARKMYQTSYDNLNNAITTLDGVNKNITENWGNAIEEFKNISLSFKFLVINALKYSNFSEVIGISRLPVNMRSPLFSVKFDNINQQSLRPSQTAIFDFLKEVDYNFTVIEDEFRAREILYNNTFMKSEQQEPVHEILSDISSILKFSSSITMRRFGSQLTEQDLVCAISILRDGIAEFDFFPLEPFRPRCEVNSSIFDIMASQASSKRKSKLMLEIITNSVKTGKEDALSKLVDSVHSAYLGVTDKTLADFGNSITEQDIICMISEKFPSKDTYDFIDLNPFRPNCSSVNPDRFKALLQDASKQRQLANGIKTDLQLCQAFKVCFCLKGLLETKYQSTEADLLRAIKQLSPSWQQNGNATFCGPPCDSCVHL